MPVAESLCCGTPVVGFKAGGPETITIPEYSKFVEYDDTNALENVICEFMNKEFCKEEISERARVKYSKREMALEYLELYKKVSKAERL